jgi:N-acetyl-gamma-glutamyl-phosphate reductase
MKHTCVVIGAAGYTGRELVRILSAHPAAELAGVFGSEKRAAAGAAQTVAELHPSLRGRRGADLEVRAYDLASVLALEPRVVFLATPHEASEAYAAELLGAAARRETVVIDLSAAFRFKDAGVYPKHYGFEHRHPNLLERAVYGLPELFHDRIAKATLVAAAGCYPTSAILPLAPLVKAGAVDRSRRPIIDSTSGVSGAGRSPSLKSLFCEVSLAPYGVFAHRHQPEIDAYAGCGTVFTPHLGAFDRGILSTIHVELAEGWTGARAREALEGAYGRSPFVRLLAAGQWPSVAAVRGTNYVDIALQADDERRHLIVVSALDNLVKGASGQAVQCMNIRLGLPEAAGFGSEVA